MVIREKLTLILNFLMNLISIFRLDFFYLKYLIKSVRRTIIAINMCMARIYFHITIF